MVIKFLSILSFTGKKFYLHDYQKEPYRAPCLVTVSKLYHVSPTALRASALNMNIHLKLFSYFIDNQTKCNRSQHIAVTVSYIGGKGWECVRGWWNGFAPRRQQILRLRWGEDGHHHHHHWLSSRSTDQDNILYPKGMRKIVPCDIVSSCRPTTQRCWWERRTLYAVTCFRARTFLAAYLSVSVSLTQISLGANWVKLTKETLHHITVDGIVTPDNSCLSSVCLFVTPTLTNRLTHIYIFTRCLSHTHTLHMSFNILCILSHTHIDDVIPHTYR